MAKKTRIEDIDMAVRAIRKDSLSDEEMRHAGKVMTELDGTELFTRITERLTDEAMSDRLAKAMAVFVDTVNMTVTRQKEKVFVIPDNIIKNDKTDFSSIVKRVPFPFSCINNKKRAALWIRQYMVPLLNPEL